MMDDKTAYVIATGRVLHDFRKSLGLSTADLAQKSGVPQSRIEQIEEGSIAAVAADLLCLADGMDVPVERLTARIDTVIRELMHG